MRDVHHIGTELGKLVSQERLLAERRIQHLESSSSSTRQELSAARLAGIAERQRDDRQISTLKAQVRGLRCTFLQRCGVQKHATLAPTS